MKLKAIVSNLLMMLILGVLYPVWADTQILIYPFANRGGRDASWFSDALMETLSHKFKDFENIAVYSQDDAYDKEIEISSIPGLINEQSAFAAGKSIHAGQVFTGSFFVRGNTILIEAKLIEVHSGEDEYLSDSEKRKEPSVIYSVKLKDKKEKFSKLVEKVVSGFMAKVEQLTEGNPELIQKSSSEQQEPAEKSQTDSLVYAFLTKGFSQHFSDPAKAESLYNQALEVDSSYFAAPYFAGLVLQNQKKYAESLKSHFQAERILFQREGQRTFQYASLMGSIADSYVGKKDYENALKNYLESRDIMASIGLYKTVPYAEILSEIGHLHFSRKQIDEAMKYYGESKDILNSLGFENSATFAKTLHHIGDVQFNKWQMDSALATYIKSEKIHKKLGRESSYNYAGLINNIGNGYLGQNKLEKALDYYTESRKLLLQLGKNQSLGYALLLNNMGIIHRKKGKNDQALEYYKRCKKILDSLDQKNTGYYAQLMKNMGMLYFDQWKLEKAMKYYQKSKEIREQLGQQCTSNYAQLLHGIGLIYQMKGKHDETVDYYERSKKLLDSLDMQTTSIYADLMHSYGFMYDVSYMPVEAYDHYSKSREIRDALQLNNTFDYAVLMHDIGNYYLKHQSRPCQAIPYEKRAMQIKEELGIGDIKEHRRFLADLSKDCEEGSPTKAGFDPRVKSLSEPKE